jgi:hypothetical protein
VTHQSGFGGLNNDLSLTSESHNTYIKSGGGNMVFPQADRKLLEQLGDSDASQEELLQNS